MRCNFANFFIKVDSHFRHEFLHGCSALGSSCKVTINLALPEENSQRLVDAVAFLEWVTNKHPTIRTFNVNIGHKQKSSITVDLIVTLRGIDLENLLTYISFCFQNYYAAGRLSKIMQIRHGYKHATFVSSAAPIVESMKQGLGNVSDSTFVVKDPSFFINLPDYLFRFAESVHFQFIGSDFYIAEVMASSAMKHSYNSKEASRDLFPV